MKLLISVIGCAAMSVLMGVASRQAADVSRRQMLTFPNLHSRMSQKLFRKSPHKDASYFEFLTKVNRLAFIFASIVFAVFAVGFGFGVIPIR